MGIRQSDTPGRTNLLTLADTSKLTDTSPLRSFVLLLSLGVFTSGVLNPNKVAGELTRLFELLAYFALALFAIRE